MAQKLTVVLLLLLCVGSGSVGGQRVAPGVPPQKYQQYQAPSSPQAQQQQQEYRQAAHQQQHPGSGSPAGEAVPPPPPPNNQAPAPTHRQRPSSEQLINPRDDAQEREHMKEHMPVPIDTSRMSAAELQFHHFKMLDVDGNHKVDGNELVKSLLHTHDEHGRDANTFSGQGAQEAGAKPMIYTDDELTAVVDNILGQHDKNNDGYIDYMEFAQARG